MRAPTECVRPDLRSGPVLLGDNAVDWCTWCDGRRELDRLRILVLGAGVIGSVYAGKMLEAGHEVVLLARGSRLVDLQTHGLILEDAESGNRSVFPVPSASEPENISSPRSST